MYKNKYVGEKLEERQTSPVTVLVSCFEGSVKMLNCQKSVLHC